MGKAKALSGTRVAAAGLLAIAWVAGSSGGSDAGMVIVGAAAARDPSTAAVNAASNGTPYIVVGSCRDGAPNGAYELRSRNGRPRVVGAFARGRRTGTFIFWNSSGDRIAVVPYDEDRKVGTVALWYEPPAAGGEPRRKQESAYAGGVLDGTTRSWNANGEPRAEYRYEQGVLAEAFAWNGSGQPLSASGARELAERDRAADAAVYAALERLVAEHAPACD